MRAVVQCLGSAEDGKEREPECVRPKQKIDAMPDFVTGGKNGQGAHPHANNDLSRIGHPSDRRRPEQDVPQRAAADARYAGNEEDADDMASSFQKEEGQLWNTWQHTCPDGETIDIEMYLGNEDDFDEDDK